MIKPRKSNFSVVVIVDGADEKWYLEKVKENYRPEILGKIKIEPDLVQKKKVSNLFSEAKTRIERGCSKVILVLDFDEIVKDGRELKEFKKWYVIYQTVKTETIKKYAWMEKLVLIINSPCIEYWFLLHFRKTTKFYPDIKSMKNDMSSIPELRDYEKSNTFYMKNPNIYLRLGGNKGLMVARKNAVPFNLEYCQNKGFSEMNQLFDFFDSLEA